MKKSLIALAVLAASGVAMAQSSVTLYGVADLGLVKSSGVSAQMTGNGVMNNGSSRLGVRGVEDLGGGLKASFNFEQGINGENGVTDQTCNAVLSRTITCGTAANPALGNATFQRAANMALSGGFGRFQMGRTLNPSFYGVAAWELTGAANYSVVGTQFNWTGQGPRTNSVFQYTTPNMGGFSGTLGYIMKPDNGGNAKYDLNVVYKNGPLAAALSYNKVNNGNKGMALGASYDFGAFKVAGSLQDSDIVGLARDPKGFTIGATMPIGAFAVTLDIARDTEYKDTDLLLEAKYALSKRTFAYAAYYKDGDKKLVTGAKSHLGLGIRHNF